MELSSTPSEICGSPQVKTVQASTLSVRTPVLRWHVWITPLVVLKKAKGYVLMDRLNRATSRDSIDGAVACVLGT